MRARALLAAAACSVLSACAALRPPPPPTVVFLTDFGLEDDSVALCKGVMLSVEPRLRVVDLTHQAPVYDVRAAGRLLDGAARHFPPGTVFVAVVDPGVGTDRRPIAARTRAGRLYVAPDNGLLTRVLEREGLAEARVIAAPEVMLAEVSGTFHGRDVFSPAAAHLAAGRPLESFGPPAGELVRLGGSGPRLEEGVLRGTVEFIEKPFGNVITDIPRALVEETGIAVGDRLQVRIGRLALSLPYLRTFGDVAVDQALALPSSREMLSFSVNQGDFAARFGTTAGQDVEVRRGR